MSSTSRIPDAASQLQPAPKLASVGWALRRAALGFLMLIVMVMLGAWLLWASIDDDAAAAGAQDAGEVTTPQR